MIDYRNNLVVQENFRANLTFRARLQNGGLLFNHGCCLFNFPSFAKVRSSTSAQTNNRALYLMLTVPFQLHTRQQDVLFDLGKQKGRHMQQLPANSHVYDFLAELKTCSRKGDLQEGRRIHVNVEATGNSSNIFVATALINMYAKCGSMIDARRVFDGIQKPDIVSCTALIMGYAENGEGEVALDFFTKLKTGRGCSPNSVTYVAALKACTSLADGRRSLERCREIHLEIGYHMNHFVQNTLIDMYSKCGSMRDARKVFESIQKPDVVSWNILTLGYVDNGEGRVALDCFSRMKTTHGCAPDCVTYVAAIRACTSLAADGDETEKEKCLKLGREIHSEIGQHMDHFLHSTLINMYAKCGSIVEARWVFEGIHKPDVVSWNTLILGYAENGMGEAALDFFSRMKTTCRCAPNSVTYLAAIKACSSQAVQGDGSYNKEECLKKGREIHSEIGSELNISVQNALIDMYAKCSSMEDAHRVFDGMQKPDTVSWTALLLGYADSGQGHAALDLFSKMKAAGGCVPDSVTYVAALKTCGSIGALAIGRKFHLEISDFSVHIVTCLVDFYAKCGSMTEACEVFDLHSATRVVPTWNALLAGYSSFGDTDSVFKLFDEMQDQGFRPNTITFVCMLSCCSHAGLVDKAREFVEAMAMQYGITPSVTHYSCMVDVLGRANQLEEAVALLQSMPCNPDAVIWMTLLGACRKWKNVEIGRLAFRAVIEVDENAAAAYMLMAQIYGSRGLWEEQEGMLETKMRKFGCLKLPGQAYVVDELGKMVKFVIEEEGIQDKLKQFLQAMKG